MKTWRCAAAVVAVLVVIANADEVPASTSDRCQCQIFVQSSTTSQMIHLPVELSGSQCDEDCQPETCVRHCQQQADQKNADLWTTAHQKACKALLTNPKKAVGHLEPSQFPVRGTVQAYYRTADHIWKPLGLEYRRKLTCSRPVVRRKKRSTREESRKIGTNNRADVNSIDAQSVIVTGTDQPTASAAEPIETPPESRPMIVNISPLRMALKRVGFLSPMVDRFFGMVNQVDLTQVLERLRLGGLMKRYQQVANHFGDEVDAGHCFLEYMMYTVFNHRFANAERGFQQTLGHFLIESANAVLEDENATQIVASLYKQLAPNVARTPEPNPINLNSTVSPPPEFPDVAVKIVRYYLRNYFSQLSGSRVSVDPNDPNNNPDSLADLVEQASRPFFLSVFGVVPGVPASGRMDPRILFAVDNSLDGEERFSENRLKPDMPLRKVAQSPAPPKTGYLLYDVGNSVVGHFQRASDATHGAYCFKQYFVNKVWDRFRGSVRSMLKTIG